MIKKISDKEILINLTKAIKELNNTLKNNNISSLPAFKTINGGHF